MDTSKHWTLGTAQPSPMYGRVHHSLAELRAATNELLQPLGYKLGPELDPPIKPACENE